MKRFYEEVTIEQLVDGYLVLLDKRPLLSPAKNRFLIPTRPLAQAIADEWHLQDQKIHPDTMNNMKLAATVIDRIEPNLDDVRQEIASYAETDLLSYRVDKPEVLSKRQARIWGPCLEWSKTRFAPGLKQTTGILPVTQPKSACKAIRYKIANLDPWVLAGLAEITQISGSLLLAIAFTEVVIDLDQLIEAAMLDEIFQEEIWGQDEEAVAMRLGKEKSLRQAATYLRLLEKTAS